MNCLSLLYFRLILNFAVWSSLIACRIRSSLRLVTAITFMPGKLFNSPAQHLLVSMHRLVSPHLNLHGGIFGKVYRHIYFSYKNIIDRHLIATARKLAKPPVSLIKIDVQGAELLVLRGMPQTLRTNDYPPILVEYSPDDLVHAGVTPEKFFSTFDALGYRPHTLPELSPRHPDWFIDNTRGAYLDLAMIHSTATA